VEDFESQTEQPQASFLKKQSRSREDVSVCPLVQGTLTPAQQEQAVWLSRFLVWQWAAK